MAKGSERLDYLKTQVTNTAFEHQRSISQNMLLCHGNLHALIKKKV